MAISIRHNKSVKGRTASRLRRQIRGRKKIHGSAERPRLVVTRSNKHLVAQVVDDLQGHTLASASTMEADLRGLDGDKTAKAKRVGELVADRAKAAGVATVVFDRAGNKYAGRVAALADGAREGGLEF
ncbi:MULTISPECIES: 50S ribosomal protein L18 [Aeromicrobium]|jgi:large subunit ribosomal protein L18|uniref:Large ribosomal subunit protein uL18 n=1 Tax=Aeromicrobium endophyticum TaxID=2292704 RepID=A0A371P906_9ACTN|nr:MULTISPECIES: 50S ribosomal protein L18 [Aeromicrobium]KQX74811.1 50S ribosomal protein L18 [Aeromicrobium sp. Root472D3]MBD8607233.1 50S ribosomal protein L18 [Aeromicrobium sp. CFBP 8757]MCL8251923.1 50S ribosomal protein L18 [Aeromicrobium fastidiosum]REK72382.1 50S ribosomal protein L18 [Aeromicrobium endophyticum]